MRDEEYTTTAIDWKDLDYLKKIKEKHGYASVRVVIAKLIKVIKLHKFEEEIR